MSVKILCPRKARVRIWGCIFFRRVRRGAVDRIWKVCHLSWEKPRGWLVLDPKLPWSLLTSSASTLLIPEFHTHSTPHNKWCLNNSRQLIALHFLETHLCPIACRSKYPSPQALKHLLSDLLMAGHTLWGPQQGPDSLPCLSMQCSCHGHHFVSLHSSFLLCVYIRAYARCKPAGACRCIRPWVYLWTSEAASGIFLHLPPTLSFWVRVFHWSQSSHLRTDLLDAEP